MERSQNRLRTSLFVFLISVPVLLLVIVPMPGRVASVTPQGKGGEVIAKPSPTPKKTTTKRNPPPKTTNNSKTNQTTKSASEATSAAEMMFWSSIKDSTNPDDLKEYLKKYPDGEFAGLAKNRLGALEAAAKEDAARKEEAKRKAEELRRHPNAGTVVKNNSGMELIYVPPGSFMMGSNIADTSSDINARWWVDEKPVHQVTIKEGFYMGRYEVTQAQWQILLGRPQVQQTADGATLPVQVNWHDARKLIDKLNQMNDGYNYRLPTEAEWEYACRAGTTTEFAFGSSLSSDQANFDGTHPYDAAGGLWIVNPSGVYRKTIIPVGSFAPNAFGLFDMHGNVSEWCEDLYHATYAGAPSDGSAWLSGGEQDRVIRGGGWLSWEAGVRSASRSHDGPGQPKAGFRLVAIARTQ